MKDESLLSRLTYIINIEASRLLMRVSDKLGLLMEQLFVVKYCKKLLQNLQVTCNFLMYFNF